MQIPAEVTEQILALVSTIVVALLAWVAAAIRSRFQNQYVQGAMLRLTDAVGNAVRAVEHELSNEIREAGADGKITPEEAASLRDKALGYTKLYLGPDGTKEVEKIVGTAELSRVVSSMVEAQLHKLKNGT